MNKVFGLISEFSFVREEGTRTVVCYGMEAVDEQNATWIEVYLPKKHNPLIGFKEVKEAIIADIDACTDEKILKGFQYEDNDGIVRNVWLSRENQSNYSEAQRLADKAGSKNYEPVTFKIGEDEDGNAKYRTFDTLSDLNTFYFAVFTYIKQTLADGWQKKDSIDWTPYESLFPQNEGNSNGGNA